MSFRYPKAPTATVEGVNVRIDPGERCAIIGPNGSGKSTLLSLLAGLNMPEEGSVHLQGVDTRTMGRRECARKVTLMPQVLPPVPGISVRELVAQGRFAESGVWGMLRHTSGKDEDTVACLVAAGVEVFADRDVDSLSGGERQRVRLALALRQHAPLLLLDEPLAHLDIHHQFDMLDTVSHVAEEQKLGVVAVLHELDLAVRWAKRVVVVHNGHLVADGKTSEVLTPDLLRRVFHLEARVTRQQTLEIVGQAECVGEASG
ncbi:ABC transporter ATP-binding protein [Corynebacterium anserum]|nr:ABC transporter ATP-binding protein [Corynebacterium anserum]MBC2682227.1 ATP-binding cassette domain-containing protein [Corynebacterium anserum]